MTVRRRPREFTPNEGNKNERLATTLRRCQERSLDDLKALLRIPSVSSLPAHSGDVRLAAEWTARRLERAGLENVAIRETAGHPVVTAEWLHAADRPTILIYGHFDVQPADPLELWTSPPFEPEIRDDRIYARGASDNTRLTNSSGCRAFAAPRSLGEC